MPDRADPVGPADVVRFVLELCALAGLAYWGATLDASVVVRVLVAVAAPLAFAVLWGRFLAPRAAHPLTGAARWVGEVGLFAVASATLVAAGAWPFGVALFVAYVLDAIAIERATARRRRSPPA